MSSTVFHLDKLLLSQKAHLVNAFVLVNGTSANIAISHILPKTKFLGLHFCCKQCGSIIVKPIPNSVK